MHFSGLDTGAISSNELMYYHLRYYDDDDITGNSDVTCSLKVKPIASPHDLPDEVIEGETISLQLNDPTLPLNENVILGVQQCDYPVQTCSNLFYDEVLVDASRSIQYDLVINESFTRGVEYSLRTNIRSADDPDANNDYLLHQQLDPFIVVAAATIIEPEATLTCSPTDADE